MKSSQRTLRNRSLRIESLENRELLSVNVAEFEAIQKTYAELDIAESIEQYNVIELSAEELTAADLQNAVDTAAKTEQDDLIVVRTTRIYDDLVLEDKPINIDIDSANFGSVALVTLGDAKFEMYSSSDEGLITITNGNVALGAVVLNSTDTFLHIDKVLQVNEKAKLLTSQTACVVERDSRPGNYTIFDETTESAEVPDFTYYGAIPLYYGLTVEEIIKRNESGTIGGMYLGPEEAVIQLEVLFERYYQYYPERRPGAQAIGSQIGTKTYDVTIDLQGTEEAYLTGLSALEKDAIINNPTSYLGISKPYDAEKTGNNDGLLCWASVSANMLAFTGWGNVPDCQTEDDILDYFNDHFDNKTGHHYYSNEWFLTGDYQLAGDPNEAQPTSTGGAFYPSMNYDSLANMQNVSSVSDLDWAVDQLKSDSAVGLGIGKYTYDHDLLGGHGLTMWGVVYDTAVSDTSPDYYVSLLISDSDDGSNGGVNAPNQLHNLPIDWEGSHNQYHFTTYGDNRWYLRNATSLAKSTAPDYPENLTAVQGASRTVQLDWNAASVATSYEVYWLRTNGTEQLLTTTASTSYRTPNVTFGDNTFRVYAVANGVKSAAASATVTVRPAAPTGLTATPQVSRNVNLSWNAVPGATHYQIYWKNTSGQNVIIGTSTTSSFTTPRVANGSNTFYVYAWADDVRSANYAVVTTTVGLPAPTGLTAVPQVSRNVNLTWNAVPSATSYEVYWLNSSGVQQLLTTTTSTAYTTARVTFGDNTFRVYAVSGSGKSSAASVTTTVRPAAPTGLTAVPKTSRNVDLTWDAVPSATYYQIYWKNTSGQNVVIGTSTTSSFTTPRVAYGDNRFYVYTWADDIRSENYASVMTTV